MQVDRLKMVEQIARFEYIITDSELEALVLENNLIKEYSPRLQVDRLPHINYGVLPIMHNIYARFCR
mgnify:CR=1 FL=1